MGKASVNLQDSFLNQVRKDNSEIEMVLLDGTRLTGLVRGFDNFTVIVNTQGNQHLVYKHAIGQIIGRRPLQEPIYQQQEQERPPQPPREGGRPQPPREGQQRREPRPERTDRPEPRPERPPQPRKEDTQSQRDRFNTIDIGDLKLPQGEKP